MKEIKKLKIGDKIAVERDSIHGEYDTFVITNEYKTFEEGEGLLIKNPDENSEIKFFGINS